MKSVIFESTLGVHMWHSPDDGGDTIFSFAFIQAQIHMSQTS